MNCDSFHDRSLEYFREKIDEVNNVGLLEKNLELWFQAELALAHMPPRGLFQPGSSEDYNTSNLSYSRWKETKVGQGIVVIEADVYKRQEGKGTRSLDLLFESPHGLNLCELKVLWLDREYSAEALGVYLTKKHVISDAKRLIEDLQPQHVENNHFVERYLCLIAYAGSVFRASRNEIQSLFEESMNELLGERHGSTEMDIRVSSIAGGSLDTSKFYTPYLDRYI